MWYWCCMVYGTWWCILCMYFMCLKSPGRHQRTCKVKVIAVIPSFTRFHKTKHFICKLILTFFQPYSMYVGRVGNREAVDKRLFSRKPSGSSKPSSKLLFMKSNIWKQFFFSGKSQVCRALVMKRLWITGSSPLWITGALFRPCNYQPSGMCSIFPLKFHHIYHLRNTETNKN